MIDASNRMSREEYLKLVGTNQLEIPEGATIIQRLFGAGAPLGDLVNRGITIKAEDKVSAEHYANMKRALRDQRYVGFFTHVGNESGERGNELRTQRRQMKKKLIGMVPGTTDWIHIWTTFGTIGAGVIELKRPGVLEGGLSINQAMVRDWCKASGIPWACHNSADKAFDQLVQWKGARHV